MRFTIERLRTLVLVAGGLLVIALAGFLAIGKLRSAFNGRDLPKRLGLDIQQEANGWVFSHALGAHSQYKIHASKLIQMTAGKGGHVLLHDVQIELYGDDGSRVDRIEGNEFEYDQKNNVVTAAGPVEITLMRPGVAPAIAPKATAGQALSGMPKGNALAGAAKAASSSEIRVHTSGLTFDTKSGAATTAQHVDFSTGQGKGSSIGASYDSKEGHLVLNREVELNTERAGQTVVIHARHAEFERETDICDLQSASADYRGGEAIAAQAKVLFRPDGSASRLDATGGFTLATATGSHIAAPSGQMDFDEHNQPHHGHLEGGVTLDSARQEGNQTRQMHGTAPTAELDFSPKGELRHVHLERGVEMQSHETTEAAGKSNTGPLRVSRTWRAPITDVEFREAGNGKVEPASIHGTQGVVITGESQRGKGAVVPSRLSSDEVTSEFGSGSVLNAMTGVGNASMEQTTAAGTRQTSTGDRLEVHFASHSPGKSAAKYVPGDATNTATDIQSAMLDGHVVLVQEPSAKPGSAPPATMRATAGHANYEGVGEWLHLTVSPRVVDGALQLTADKIDVSHVTGDAFAHGDVKATWMQNDPAADPQHRSAQAASAPNGLALGGRGPSHVIASDAQLHQASGEVTFTGHARLWQQANSVAGPTIVLDRVKQTLVARSTDPLEPVRAVLLSAASPPSPSGPAGSSGQINGERAGADSGKDATGKQNQPSVIRVRAGDLKYSDAEHKAILHGGALGTVVAETATATSVSNELELLLLPPGNHAGKDGGPGQVDRMTADGHVVVTSGGRRGTGEQLIYTGETGQYVLTGTAADPPRMKDPMQGTVTGEALIFNSRDNSISAEGGAHKTTTETTAPKRTAAPK